MSTPSLHAGPSKTRADGFDGHRSEGVGEARSPAELGVILSDLKKRVEGTPRDERDHFQYGSAEACLEMIHGAADFSPSDFRKFAEQMDGVISALPLTKIWATVSQSLLKKLRAKDDRVSRLCEQAFGDTRAGRISRANLGKHLIVAQKVLTTEVERRAFAGYLFKHCVPNPWCSIGPLDRGHQKLLLAFRDQSVEPSMVARVAGESDGFGAP